MLVGYASSSTSHAFLSSTVLRWIITLFMGDDLVLARLMIDVVT